MVKICSVSTAPGQQGAEVERQQGDHRRHGVAQGVLQHHAAFGEALGARRADVVGAHRLQHALRVWRISTAASALPSTKAGMMVGGELACQFSPSLT
jgi:hypothetical protein